MVERQQSATLWTAEFARKDKELGTVAEGKIADIVVLNDNPLSSVRNLRSINTVIQAGRVQPLGYHWSYTNSLPRTQTVGPPGEGPRPPQLDTVNPVGAAEGANGTTLTLRGRNFVATSVGFFERQPLETTLVSPTELKVVVPQRFLRTAGVYNLRVRTPRPGGGGCWQTRSS